MYVRFQNEVKILHKNYQMTQALNSDYYGTEFNQRRFKYSGFYRSVSLFKKRQMNPVRTQTSHHKCDMRSYTLPFQLSYLDMLLWNAK